MTEKPPITGRRERQAAARLEQILDAAARLFAERGFHRTTTRDIAEAADIAEGTLYNYFLNKNDLLFGILKRLEQGNEAAFGLVESNGPDEARRTFIQMLFTRRDYYDSNSVMLQAILSEILSNAELRRRYMDQLLGPTISALDRNLQQREDLGQIRDVDIPAVTRLLASLWIGMFVLQVLDEPMVKDEWDRVADALSDVLFEGIKK